MLSQILKYYTEYIFLIHVDYSLKISIKSLIWLGFENSHNNYISR